MLVHLNSIIYSTICYCTVSNDIDKKDTTRCYLEEAKEIDSYEGVKDFTECFLSKEKYTENKTRILNFLKSKKLSDKFYVKLPDSKTFQVDFTTGNYSILKKCVDMY